MLQFITAGIDVKSKPEPLQSVIDQSRSTIKESASEHVSSEEIEKGAKKHGDLCVHA